MAMWEGISQPVRAVIGHACRIAHERGSVTVEASDIVSALAAGDDAPLVPPEPSWGSAMTFSEAAKELLRAAWAQARRADDRVIVVEHLARAVRDAEPGSG